MKDVNSRWSWFGCLLICSITQTVWAAPCTSADAGCTEWVVMGGGPARALVYRTYSLSARNEGITRALIIVHGQGRDAGNYFRNVLAAAFLAGALENTVLISPRFASNNGTTCNDTLAPGELNWKCDGADAWRAGGGAAGNEQITSFDVVDEALRKLAQKDVFPNLRAVVVAGHSAGGQFVTRYEMANQVHDRLGIPITYVVANPSAYAYLDGLRPSASAVPSNVAAAAPGYHPPTPANPPQPFVTFADARNCTAYDNWPYGLHNRVGYSARLSDDQLKKQLAARPTTYLLGELDILPLYGFDGSCSAMAQGPTRLARGLAFARYVNEKYGAQHKEVVVPACGHNARCMFAAEPALPVIFPKE
jgi:pimeloyl-ACP methyl ester carboxylesterase